MAKLSKLASELEATILAMPPDEQLRAKQSVVGIVAAAQGLGNVPPAAMTLVWKILVAFIPRAAMPGANAGQLVRQIIDGAPRLLEPSVRAKILASVEEA